MFSKRKAQGTLEYALLIAAVVAALLSIQVYLKRHIQGRLRQSSDQIGDPFVPAPEGLYEFLQVDTIKTHTVTTEHHPQEAGGALTTIDVNDSGETEIGDFWRLTGS